MHHWRDDALCRDFPQRWWFPEQGGAYQAALFVCSGCPSREPCLRYAIDNDITHGIWGGETESKRRAKEEAFHRSAVPVKVLSFGLPDGVEAKCLNTAAIVNELRCEDITVAGKLVFPI